jgi:hypothetical protein
MSLYNPDLLVTSGTTEDTIRIGADKINANLISISEALEASINGLLWQENVKDKDLSIPPASPITGDRYIIAANPAGAWLNHATHIAQYGTSSWVFTVPVGGYCLTVTDENADYIFNGTSWVVKSSSTPHNSLARLNEGDYLHLTATQFGELVTNRNETVQDIVGGMISGNTESAIAVDYQDTDGTLDFSVIFGGEPGAVSSSSSGQAGVAASASRSDHNHDLSAHAHSGATDGGRVTWGNLDKTVSSIADITTKSHTVLTDIGSNTHAAIDSFIATKGTASGLASLNSGSTVIQNPANAQTSSAAAKIPISDANGKLDGWVTDAVVPDATTSVKGKIQLAGQLSGSAASPVVVGVKELSGTNLTLGAIRDGEYLVRSGSSIVSGVSSATVADDSITLVKMEHGIHGDLLYYGVNGTPTRIHAGDAGQILSTSGPGADPSWITSAAAITYGLEPGVVFSSGSGQPGLANSISRSDHSHDLGEHAHSDATNGGQISYSSLINTPTSFAPASHGSSAHTGTIGAWSQIDKTVSNIADITNKDHSSLTGIGSTSHATIDTFIGSKAGVNGIASLDANSKVVQDPANATSTPTANKIPIANASGKLDSWITLGTTSTSSCAGNDSRLSDNRIPVAHVLNSASHVVSGLTAGHVLRATGASAFGFGAVAWADIDKTTSDIANLTTKSHTSLSDIGTNTHAALDTHVADATKHRIINDSGTSATELWSAGKVSSAISAAITGIVEFQDSVKDKDISTPPTSPISGDRYIVKATGTGAWAGHDNAITTWNGSAWTFVAASEGMCVYVDDEDILYVYNGTNWLPINNYALASSEPGAVSSSTSGGVGTSTQVARADHNHDLGTHAHSDGTNGGQIAYSALSGIPTTFAPIIGSTSTTAVAGNDSRLSDSRVPTSHGSSAHTGTIGDHATNLLNVGSNSHAQIDTHLGAAAPHSGHAALNHSHAESSVTFAATGGHTHNGTSGSKITYSNLLSIPTTFTPAAHGSSAHTGTIGDHTTQLSNIGSNTHAQIDTHLAAAAPHSGHALSSHGHAASAITAGSFPGGTFTFEDVQLTGSSSCAISSLSDAATITPNFSVANNFTVTLGGNRALANPTNLTAGQSGLIFLVQDATGNRTISFGSYFDFANGIAPTLSTPGNSVDILSYFVRTTTSICCQLIKAFS